MNTLNRSMPRAVMALLLTLMLVFMAACGQQGTNTGDTGASQPPTEASSPSATPEETKAPATYPLTVKDDTGTELTFEKAPARVVTLAPSETETIFAMGSGEQVVGVDEWSNYPPEAANLAKVGDMTTNIEAVVALEPELVLASTSANTDAITKLRELNIPVYATDPKTYDAVIAKVELLGDIMDKQVAADAVADHMREVKQQIADAVKDAEKKKVYLEFSPGWTVGADTFLDELITIAGGINISASKVDWYEVSAEEVVAQNPEIIIYPDFGEEPSPIVQGIESRPGWEVIDAVKNNQMFKVTNDPLVRVGPRLADGLLELAKVIHPELVK